MPVNKQIAAFLFMPDISGFTEFVGETEIEHSTHIIQELLEIIINENNLYMSLLEIEGDAVFFYRLNKIPSINDIFQQAENMFVKFHQHLLHYEHQRICQCGACRTANNLTLKFVIHAGLVGSYYVRNQFKLIGGDVILLHRLMKNRIPFHEYLVFTEPFFKLLSKNDLNKQNLSVIDESEEFDGKLVPYKYVAIEQWYEKINVPGTDGLTSEKDMVPVITVTKEINSPADIVFSFITDLSKRTEWMNGVKKIELVSKYKINQAGTQHRCIVDNNSVSIFKTKYFKQEENSYSYAEVDSKNEAFGQQYTVERLSPKSCIVKIQFLVKNNMFQRSVFSIFMKNKVTRSFKKSLSNLQAKV